MKRKGFTLIELIAIVVLIAVIALITTPQILKVIENGQKSTFLDSVNGIVRTVQLDNSKNEFLSGSYIVTNGIIKDSSGNTLKHEGGKDENGTISVDESGKISYAIHNNKWCVTKNKSESTATVSETEDGTCELAVR